MPYKNNKEMQAIWAKIHRAKVHLKILYMMGKKCNKCGEIDLRTLEIHHVNGGGSREREPSGSKTGGKNLQKFYEDIAYGRRGIEDLLLLCANCHKIEGYETGQKFDFIKFDTGKEPILYPRGRNQFNSKKFIS